MRIISDIHIHSRHARACSKDLTPVNLDKWARIKGVNLIGTGDFTHPLWLMELKSSLEEAENGFYRLRRSQEAISSSLDDTKQTDVRFILSAEVACIYSQDGRLRRVHYVLLLPSFQTVDKFVKLLLARNAKLASDGRPILGINSQDLLKMLLEASPEALMIPAHAWTPYFGIFGSKSGFDSIEECFGDMTKHIYAFETGLSSDPEMNWRFSGTDKFTILSASDAHSLPRIGREATVLDIPEGRFNYQEFYRIIKEKDPTKLKYTIEYFPEEGKYHLDGHSSCKVSFEPRETKKHHDRCPKCGKKLTIGVVSRVQDLADRTGGFQPKNAIGQKHLVPLEEVLSDCVGVGPKSKTVQNMYWKLIERAGNEFAVILDLPIIELEKVGGGIVAEAVRRVREEEVYRTPGYDGTYGIIRVFTDKERKKFLGKTKGVQNSLF